MAEVEKLSDIRSPDARVIEGHRGKQIIFEPLSLDVVCEIEDLYGSFQAWQEKAMNGRSVRDLSTMLWILCSNKEDFNDSDREFRRCFPLKNVTEIQAFMLELVEKSMPKQPPKLVGQKKGKTKGRKSAGRST